MLHAISNSQNNPVLEFLTNKKWAFVRHFILIMVVAANFELLNTQGLERFANLCKIPFEVVFIGNFSNAFLSILLIYINLYYLFPRFLKKGLYLKYITGVILLIFLLFSGMQCIEYYYAEYYNKSQILIELYSGKGIIQTMTYPFVFLGSTTGYKFFKTWIQDQAVVVELQEEKLKAELNQLKNQVNPHFLFNTLNNLHVLIQTNPEKASQITLGLSDVLRYQIYDSQHDSVLLSKEIDLILQYLELEKIRRDNLKTNVKVQGTTSGILVPPLLFINFIENAIKHSNNNREAIINIFFKIENGFLIFEISNTKTIANQKISEGGFGLANVKKRLNLLFQKNYSLDITNDDVLFSVELKFPI